MLLGCVLALSLGSLAAVTVAPGVTSVTGTANQVTASPVRGNVVLTLPQNIATTSSPTFNALTLTTPLAVSSGGNGAATFTAGILRSTGGTTALTTVAGTQNKLAKWGASGTLSDSNITDDGTTVTAATSSNGNILLSPNGSGNTVVSDGTGVVVGNASQVTYNGDVPELQVLGTANGDSSIGQGRWSADGSGPWLQSVKSRNATIGSFTIVQDGDDLGLMRWYGDDGADYNSEAARIHIEVDGTPGADDMPGRILFMTTSDGGVAPTERMRISATGVVATSGGRKIKRNAQAGGYVILVSDHYVVITSTGAATLPDASNAGAGTMLIIKSASGVTTTVTPSAGDTVEGGASDSLAALASGIYISDGGTNWEKN